MKTKSVKTKKDLPANQTAEQSSVQLTPEESQLLDEIIATPTPKRIWEVDFLRGLMILFVVWDHFMWDVNDMGPFQSHLFQWLYELSIKYYHSTVRRVTHPVFVTMVVFTSGVSCSFSRSNGKRAVKMIAFALLFSAVTYAVSSIIHQELTIYFNVIHVIALSVLLWSVIEWCWDKCNRNWQKNVFGFVMLATILTSLVVGACANVKPWQNDNAMWYFLVKNQYTPGYIKFLGADSLPFLPDFGWFLIGAFLGKFIYKERKTLFPSVNEKWVSPVTFCGRYSIWIYFASQFVMYGMLMLLSQILHWI